MIRKTVAGIVSVLIAGLMMSSYGTVLYEDDFSDPAGKSNFDWTESNTFITKTFTGGACVVKNESDSFSGYLFHEFATKPAVFTATAKITRASSSVVCGFALGYDKATYNSIAVLIGKDGVFIGTPGNDLNGFSCPYLSETENTLSVSISGSKCNIFINNQFFKSIADVNPPGNNFAFFVSSKTSATYDDFVMTDVFTEGSEKTYFADDFSSGMKPEWTLLDRSGVATVSNGVLNLKTTGDSSYAIMDVEIGLTDFTCSADFSHKSGKTTSLYGLQLSGATVSDRVLFIITADRSFGVVKGGNQTFTPVSSQTIRGKAYTGDGGVVTYYHDTLKIVKGASSSCNFYINDDSVATIDNIGFNITRAGIYCLDSLDIDVDNFHAGTDPLPVKNPYISKRHNGNAGYMFNRRSVTTDPLGRLLNVNRTANGKISSGMYLTRGAVNGSASIILKK